LTVGRDEFARAMVAEGIPCSGYPFFPALMPWATERCPACGRLEMCDAAACPQRSHARPSLDRAKSFEARSLRVQFHEGWGGEEARDVAAALHKVEGAYLRD
jgi:hypothetical protein